MAFHRRILVYMALVTAVAGSFAAGCSNNDDNNNPVAPSDTTEFTQDLAEEAGVLAAESFGIFLEGIPSVASGSGSGWFQGRMIPGASTLDDSARFDTTLEAWVFRDTVAVGAEGDSTRRAVEVTAQFMLGGTPQEQRAEWDSIGVLADLDLYQRTQGSPTTEFTSSLNLDLNVTHMLLDGSPAYNVLGGGYSDATFKTSLPTEDILPRHTYLIDLTNVREGSCPDGTITVTMGAYRLVATYNQTSTVSWELHHPVEGPVVKTGSYTCTSGS